MQSEATWENIYSTLIQYKYRYISMIDYFKNIFNDLFILNFPLVIVIVRRTNVRGLPTVTFKITVIVSKFILFE